MNAIDEAVILARLRADMASGRAREVRVAARLSQADVAAAVGVDQTAIANWEAGRKKPRRGEAAIRYAELLRKLADITREAS